MSQYAYKFLARGAIGAISELAWPKPRAGRPGAWVESTGPLEPCANGVHVCRETELAHWLHDELWVVEIDGPLIDSVDCLLASRGRLLRQVDGWSDGGALRFARAARDHAAQLVAAEPGADQVRLQKLLRDAGAHLPRGATALSAFCSAMTVAWLHGGDHFDEAGYRQERAWQSSFIARDLGLRPRACVADSIAQQLVAAGVRHAFGIPGGEVLSVIDALGTAGIEYVTARHETAAGLMAEGAAAAAGAAGLLVLTVGPGVSNAVNAIANAFLDRVPLIVLSGAVDAERPGSYTHQVFDQRALLRPIVKASFVATPETIERNVREALALAQQHPRGPVHIEVPMGVAKSFVSGPAHEPAPAPVPPIPASLQEAAAWLERAERPLVIAGLEAVDREVAASLADLVRLQQLPLLTTYKAKGILDEADPLCVGAIALSPRADALVQPLIQAADVVLLVGYDPVEMRASYARPFAAHTRVIELAPVPREHAMHEAQLSIAFDLAASLRELTRRCSPARPRWPGGEAGAVRAALRNAFAPDSEAGFSPLAVSEVLSRVLPETAQLTIDTGAHRIVLSQALRARWPGQVLQSNGLCTMGYALPCAIGLALASGRRVIAAMGDGGFEMVAGELATLRDLGLPLILVVFDDRSLALIDQKQQAAGLARRGVWLGATDHVALAEAFGGRGVRVEDVVALERALLEALQTPDRFSVISCALPRGAYESLL